MKKKPATTSKMKLLEARVLELEKRIGVLELRPVYPVPPVCPPWVPPIVPGCPWPESPVWPGRQYEVWC